MHAFLMEEGKSMNARDAVLLNFGAGVGACSEPYQIGRATGSLNHSCIGVWQPGSKPFHQIWLGSSAAAANLNPRRSIAVATAANPNPRR